MKKKIITREFLQKLGFTHCDPNTGQLYKGEYKQTYNKIWAKHKYGNDKYYWAFSYYDADLYQEQMKLYNEGKWVNKEGKPKSYKPTGISMMLVHRAVYAWFNLETPSDMDVCHIDDNVDNNSIENLKSDTHGNNIRERKVQTGGRPKHDKQRDEQEN